MVLGIKVAMVYNLRPQASLRQIASGGEKVWAKQCWWSEC